MKNGLVLLLLMVALVAMTVPAGAMAPVVGPLPAVIVGSADAVDQSTTDVRLLRYVNVFNLADPGVITRRTNPDDVSKLAVWYKVNGTDASTLKASNQTALVTAMTAAEATALTTAGTQPTGKQINTATDTWLSLIEDVVDGGRTHAASAAAATVAANGATSASLGAVEGKKTITLYAVDADAAPASAVGSGSFDVYTLLAATDGFSPRTSVASGTTRGTAAGQWQQVQAGASVFTATGIGFTGKGTFSHGTPPSYNYYSWAMSLPTDTQVNPSGTIYEAKATMTASAAAAVNTPGFRLFFIANAGCHAGGTQFMSRPAGGGVTYVGVDSNIPKASASKECRIYWGAPRDLVGMADGGQLAGAGGAADKRKYALQFDMIQEETGDSGNNVVISAFSLDLIPRPVNVVPVKTWADGANGSTAMNVGFVAVNGGVAGFGSAANTVGLTNITLAMGSTNSAYGKVNLQSVAGLPAWESGKLIRSTYTMQAAGASVPTFRMMTAGIKISPLQVSELATIDICSMDAVRNALSPSVANPILAGTPKLAGSTVESYSYTHTGVAGVVLYPQMDVVQGDGSGTNNWHGWGKPGALVVNSVSMEVLNP